MQRQTRLVGSLVLGVNILLVAACTEELPAYRNPPGSNYAYPAAPYGAPQNPPPQYGQPQYPQPQYTQPQYPPVAGVYAQPAAPVQVVYYQLDAVQISQLTAPVALYSDPLLAQLLPASTYPQEVASAAQWLQAVGQPTEQDIAAQPWEPPIKVLAHYPTVLQMMAGNMDWTAALGAAFSNQTPDVMAAIQQQRGLAMNAGSLVSNQQQQVVVEPDGTIRILPPAPQLLYVPVYDARLVYTRQPQPVVITFGAGLAIGAWLDQDCDWHDHQVVEGPRWNGGWDRTDGYVRFKDVRETNGTGDAHQANKTTIVDSNHHNVTVQGWTRNATKPPPALPVAIVRRAQQQGAPSHVVVQQAAATPAAPGEHHGPVRQGTVTTPANPTVDSNQPGRHAAPVETQPPAVPPRSWSPAPPPPTPPANSGSTPKEEPKYGPAPTAPAHMAPTPPPTPPAPPKPKTPPPPPPPPPPTPAPSPTPSTPHDDGQHGDKHAGPSPTTPKEEPPAPTAPPPAHDKPPATPPSPPPAPPAAAPAAPPARGTHGGTSGPTSQPNPGK